MGTSEVVADRAVSLARAGADAESAIVDLRETGLRHRVTTVIGLLDLTHQSEDRAT